MSADSPGTSPAASLDLSTVSTEARAKRRLRVFIVDDFPLVRAGLRCLIDAQPDMRVVGEAEDGEQAWEAVRVLCRQNDKVFESGFIPNVVVMDDDMPNVDGAEATQAIRQAYPEIKVVAYVMHEDRKTLRELLVAGATGYVLKCSPLEKLFEAIRTVAVGGSYLDSALTDNVIASLVIPLLRDEAAKALLSEREDKTLHRIAEGYTNIEIAAEFRLSVKTIESFKARGMKKLGLNNRSEVVRYAMQHDWLQAN